MKHIKDALHLLNEGLTQEAMKVLDNLLGLAPNNSQALRLKAQIYDMWGRFDDSLSILSKLSVNQRDEDVQTEIEQRILEEKEALFFSEISDEGRWYFSYPKEIIWISLVGFLGCGTFLALSPQWLHPSENDFFSLIFAFSVLVLLPWMALLFVHATGIRKILVGLAGIKICKRFSEKSISWKDLKTAVIESKTNAKSQELWLHLYNEKKEKLITFNISKDRSVVKARRHFVKSILTYVDSICYLNNIKELPTNTHKSDDSQKAA